MTADTTLVELDREECFALLASMSIGRIAVASPVGSPLVVPVNYALDGEVVVFRTDTGSKLAALRHGAISFQVDLFDPGHRTGWSVLVQGIAYESAPDGAPAHVDVEPWAPGPKSHWIRIVPGHVSGRRLCLHADTWDDAGYL